ncbi:hypothetical protein MHYP_G00291520 [Metynnis hypsauchen]
MNEKNPSRLQLLLARSWGPSEHSGESNGHLERAGHGWVFYENKAEGIIRSVATLHGGRTTPPASDALRTNLQREKRLDPLPQVFSAPVVRKS